MSYVVMSNDKCVASRSTHADAQALVSKFHEYEQQFMHSMHDMGEIGLPEYEIMEVESIREPISVKDSFCRKITTICSQFASKTHNI